MRMSYLILAHEDEAQLTALLAALLPPGSPDRAFVHIDRRSALWRSLRGRSLHDPATVRLIADPVAVRWGHWSQIDAIQRLIRAAVHEGCDYAHLLSGADWPLVRREVLVDALSAADEPLCYIEAEAGRQEGRMQTFRLDARWLRLDPERDRLRYAATWELRRLSHWLDAARDSLGLVRSRPWGEWRKGWTWWSLPEQALRLLAKELPRLIASGRLAGTVCADEHVIPTIIAAHFPNRLAGYRRFIAWPDGNSSPRLLTRNDLPAMAASGAWFARKFSAAKDPFFLDLPRCKIFMP